MIIDTHSHLNFKAYDNDREEVIKRAQKADIFCIDVGVDFETSKCAADSAKKNKNIYSAIGVHPSEIKENFDKSQYLELAKNKKVVAICEIGLDYFRNKDKENQKRIFIKQLNLAKELNLPIIVHCRDAHVDLINILKNYNLRGVVHCFTGTWGQAQKYINLGFYIGINGIIFKQNLDKVIQNCPLDKILAETDCPFLGKEKRNEPVFIKEIINKIAKVKKISYQEVAEKTCQNARILFKI